MSTYVKGYDSQTKWMYFLMNYGQNIITFGIKLALILKKNLIVNLHKLKTNFENQNKT